MELITISQGSEPKNNTNDIYFNIFRETGKYCNKYNAWKRNESFILTATHKLKAKNKPKKKDVGNKRPRNNTNL